MQVEVIVVELGAFTEEFWAVQNQSVTLLVSYYVAARRKLM